MRGRAAEGLATYSSRACRLAAASCMVELEPDIWDVRFCRRADGAEGRRVCRRGLRSQPWRGGGDGGGDGGGGGGRGLRSWLPARMAACPTAAGRHSAVSSAPRNTRPSSAALLRSIFQPPCGRSTSKIEYRAAMQSGSPSAAGDGGPGPLHRAVVDSGRWFQRALRASRLAVIVQCVLTS